MFVDISDIIHNKLQNIHTKQAEKKIGRARHNESKFL